MALFRTIIGTAIVLLIAFLYAHEPEVKREIGAMLRGDKRVTFVDSSLSALKRFIK